MDTDCNVLVCAECSNDNNKVPKQFCLKCFKHFCANVRKTLYPHFELVGLGCENGCGCGRNTVDGKEIQKVTFKEECYDNHICV